MSEVDLTGSQPALSTTISDLEEEIGIRIFERTNKGIKLTEEGNEFLTFAKQAVSQYELVERKYLKQRRGRDYYTISMQHYVFAVHAFLNVIKDRRQHPKEGSYTNYLFDKGIDKILKKCGEEATEIIIAAKNPDPEEIKYEISDFLYHVMVLMVLRGVTWEDIVKELANR